METKPADNEIIDRRDLRYKRTVSNGWKKPMNKRAYEHTVGLVLNKISAEIPFSNALDEDGYDKIRRDDDFITGDADHRYITAPTSKRRYNIDKLPDNVQDIIYERLHLGNLMRAYYDGEPLGYLNKKQQDFFSSWTDKEARMIHDRKQALERVLDSLLSKGKEVKVPNAPSVMEDIIYNAGGEYSDD